MDKPVPLSLQVFHSRNEYEAQRLNRTEQLRLHDIHDVLRREEKLYVKDYALFRNKFHNIYPLQRRYSEPAPTSTRNNSLPYTYSNTGSKSTRASLFSAPGNLQRNVSKSSDATAALTSKMCNSLGEISTMTRFQRIQRKFSIASFTDHGLLTDKGDKMSRDINKVRNILFRKQNGSSPFVKTKIDASDANDVTKETVSPVIDFENDNSTGDKSRVIGDTVFEEAEEEETAEINASHQDETSPKTSNAIAGTLTDKEHRANLPMKDDETYQRRESRDSRILSVENESVDNNNVMPFLPARTRKKRSVVTWEEEDKDHFDETYTTTNTNSNNAVKTKHVDNNIQHEVDEWRSILSGRFKRLDPLQRKINIFLTDQHDFNKLFPSSCDEATKLIPLNKELSELSSQRRERERLERSRKNKIALEVLNRLGIDDDSILSNYKI